MVVFFFLHHGWQNELASKHLQFIILIQGYHGALPTRVSRKHQTRTTDQRQSGCLPLPLLVGQELAPICVLLYPGVAHLCNISLVLTLIDPVSAHVSRLAASKMPFSL